MAKRQSKALDAFEMARQMQTEQEYVTSRGVRLTIKALNPIQIEMALERVEKEHRESGAPLDPPTWELRSEIPGKSDEEQEVQVFPHTEDTLDDPDDPRQTRINRALWNRYQAAQDALLEEQGELRMRLFLLYGIELADPIPGIPEPADAQTRLAKEGIDDWLYDPRYWITLQKQMGVEVPEDDQIELPLHWLQTCATDAIDLSEMTMLWSIMSNPAGLSEEEQASFREDSVGMVRRAARANIARAFGAAEEAITEG